MTDLDGKPEGGAVSGYVALLDHRVQLYWDWRGFLFGFQWDDSIIALMFGWLTVEVWW